jgi:D-serine deaminase-like pyridoxal phosphate-dependent protein
MMSAWLAANPGKALAGALAGALVVCLVAGLGISRVQLGFARSSLATAIAERDQVRAAALACSQGVADMERAAAQAAQNARRAVEAARAASATREPQIVALAAAEQAGGALTCGDAVERVRDGLR